MKALSRNRQKILDRDYFLSSHAEEEMAEDGLERTDVENAILNGAIDKKLTRDIRGTRYRIGGPPRMAARYGSCVDSRRWAASSLSPCMR